VKKDSWGSIGQSLTCEFDLIAAQLWDAIVKSRASVLMNINFNRVEADKAEAVRC
jgi:hypothetical protein